MSFNFNQNPSPPSYEFNTSTFPISYPFQPSTVRPVNCTFITPEKNTGFFDFRQSEEERNKSREAQENERIKDLIWQDHNREYSMGVCAICSRCGGSSSSNCWCVQKKFKANITQSQIDQYKYKDNLNRLKELKERRDAIQKEIDALEPIVINLKDKVTLPTPDFGGFQFSFK